MPGTFQAVYSATKAFIDSFSLALRAELKNTGVTVTCLMPGATDTRFFERAEMLGQEEKDSPSMVAQAGFDAMMRGEADVVMTGWKNKIQATLAHVTPAGILAEQHRKMAEPGSGKNVTAEHSGEHRGDSPREPTSNWCCGEVSAENVLRKKQPNRGQ